MSTMATTSKKQVTVKLLVDRTANKVLFAEAGKDFVDFLIGLLSLPLASVIRVLTKEKMVGTLGKLYESVDNLDKTYIQSSASMTRVMKPVAALTFTPTSPDLKSTETANADEIKYYSCPRRCSPLYITPNQDTNCPYCRNSMYSAVTLIGANGGGAVVSKASSGDEEGFVRGGVTYKVLDDLVVAPLSTISSIMPQNENSTCDDELVVDIGMEEGLELLRASLQSKTVLSDVFLSKTKIQRQDGVAPIGSDIRKGWLQWCDQLQLRKTEHNGRV